MNISLPIAFVESGHNFFHIYVSRPPNTASIECVVKHKIPNDYTGTSLHSLFPEEEQTVYQCLFSTDHYHELRVVDAVVELCFDQIMSSPSVARTGTKFNDNWVFYSPSFHRIIDHIRPETGNTYTLNTTYIQERNKYPDLVIVPKSVALNCISDDIFDVQEPCFL